MFTDWVINELTRIYEQISGIGASDNLLKTLEQFNRGLYNGINSIRENVASPVAYAILALFLLLELHRIVVRFDGQQGTLGVELPLKLLFKFVIYKMVIDNVDIILKAFFNLSLHLIEGVKGVLNTGTETLTLNIESVRAVIDGMEWWEGAMLSVNILILGLLVSLSLLIANVMIIARFFEIYVLIAISPIPIATLPSDDLGIAKNFFKTFAAACLHGVFIYIVLAMMPILINSAMLGSVDGLDLLININVILGYCFVLIVSITASSRWAKSICNAM